MGSPAAGDALVIGEALIDAVVTADGLTVEHPGGSPANVALALARLGRPVRFATAVGNDEQGAAIIDHLTGSGVRFATEPRILARTSVARAQIAASGSATYRFDLEWRLGDVPVGTPRFLHVGSISAVLEPGCERVLEVLDARPAETLVSYDINARPAITGTGPDVVARVEEVARRADLVKASDEDLEALYPDRAMPEAAQHLLDLGPRAVAVTRGGAGSSWFAAAGRVDVAAPEVAVVDTIGAGDTFAAGLIDALWDGFDLDPADVLRHAAAAAAVTVSRAGANPPYRHELPS